MGSSEGSSSPHKRRRLNPPETGAYLLRPLVDKVPLTTEDGDQDVYITCVEYWNENLYIGTSAAEILHFVSLPPDPADESTEPSFILASRLPLTAPRHASEEFSRGVQQIQLLPSAGKACILCNGVVTFYSLPELSPAYGTTKVSNCRWVGGTDLNQPPGQSEDPVVMIAVQNRIMLVRIGHEARRIRNIEFPSCLVSARRDTIACVADAHSYSLLEVEHQQKIPLFPISSADEPLESGNVEDMSSRSDTPKARSSSVSPGRPSHEDSRGHARSTSLNAFIGGLSNRQPSPQPGHPDRLDSGTPESFSGSRSPALSVSPENRSPNMKPLPDPPAEGSEASLAIHKPLPGPPKPKPSRLKPHIASPTPSEFLLVTGTELSEPGVGMFVNVDGDVVRGTMEFERYPEAIVVDNPEENSPSQLGSQDQEGYILAVMAGAESEADKCIQIQRWDVHPGEGGREVFWIDVPSAENAASHVGIRHTVSPSNVVFGDVGDLLRMVRLRTLRDSSSGSSTPAELDPRTRASIEQFQKEKELFDSQTDSDGSKKGSSAKLRPGWEAERNREEAKFAQGLGKMSGSIILWSGDRIWRVIRNPLALRLDNELQAAQERADDDERQSLDRDKVMKLLHDIRDTEPKTETEFLGLNYVRQKASLLLFTDLISTDAPEYTDAALKATESALMTGGLDPRVVLFLVPSLRSEVIQGPEGIWVHGGLAKIAQSCIKKLDDSLSKDARTARISDDVLEVVKRYLLAWQRKRGYGSVTDETHVFDSIDSALLHLLLDLDAKAMDQATQQSSVVRGELNKLVDNWKGNFEKAVNLLESYQRLFTLSRLYQSRKMSKDVLRTWKRIIEGETDVGGELTIPGAELQVRRYLVKIRDQQLVEEYGPWLAARNPKLGIEVFSDDSSRVRLEPPQIVDLLKKRAPESVQDYLELLVFEKNYPQYTDDLIAYYLDTVLTVLETSAEARESLSESYSTYRALRPPKPTYLNFITQNAPPESWWKSRLRLLQLLGGGGSSQFTSRPAPTGLSYSIPTVLARIEPFQNELVSESIILDGRQGRHREALSLLTHGLGDYDTAIRYCLYGGPSPSSANSSSVSYLADADTRRTLFTHLLHQFLKIGDVGDRIERTSDLLARFAPCFDVSEVLELIPDEWSVDILGGFLAHILRDLVSSTREARVHRTLSAGLNLRVGAEHVASLEKLGGWIEDDGGVRGLKSGARMGTTEHEGHDDNEWGEMVGGDGTGIGGGDGSGNGL